MAFRLRHRRALSATACAVLAILATSATGATSASADTAPVTLSSAPLGLNTAPWDYVYAANTYGAGNQNATNSSIIMGTTSARSVADGITLPAESVAILETW